MNRLVGTLILALTAANACDAAGGTDSRDLPFPEKPFFSANNEADVLSLTNYYREIAGLEPVGISESLSRGCFAHANYMKMTGSFSHTQQGEQWTSDLGAAAGMNSVLAQNVTGMYQAVDVWMESLYHRIPILEPGLEAIGYAWVEGDEPGFGYAVMDVLGALDSAAVFSDPILFPSPGQKDVPLTFSSTEIPDPVPAEFDRPTGTVLTAIFPQDDVINPDFSSFRVIESDSGMVVDMVANQSDLMHNVVYIIPRFPLKADTEYRVQMWVDRRSSVFEGDWSFLTVSSQVL